MHKDKQKLSILNISMTSGGAEKVISLLLKRLIDDYDVSLILFYNEIHFPIPPEVKIIIFNKNPPQSVPFYKRLFDLSRFVIKYHKVIRKEKIQIAISFLAFPNLVNGIISIFNRNVKTIISERGFPSDNTTNKSSLLIAKIFYPLLYNRCNTLFSNSIYINNDLKENFGVKIPMRVIYNPIEIPKNTIEPNSLKTSIESLNIINVGTLNKRKNQHMILKALKGVNFQFRLTILGEGYLKDNLIQWGREYQMEGQVCLEGKVKNVQKYLLENHVFVLSSNTEGFPNALLEAMSIGLPSISTNCLSGPLELINDGNDVSIPEGGYYEGPFGILVNNNDVAGLKNALEYLFNNPEKRAELSQNSLVRSKHYHLNKIYSEFNSFIQYSE